MYVYFYSVHVSGNNVPIIRRIECINAVSSICYSVWATVRYADTPAYRTVAYTE